MKKLIILLVAAAISFSAVAQKSNGKAKGKVKVKKATSTTVHTSQSKAAGNRPKKVEEAFMRDYPGVTNVTWSKYKGDYTATFNNDVWRSTAIYHANGERRDTRTPLTRAHTWYILGPGFSKG